MFGQVNSPSACNSCTRVRQRLHSNRVLGSEKRGYGWVGRPPGIVETLLETEAEHRGAQYFGLNTALTARWAKKDQSCDMQLHAPAAPAFSPTNYASLHRRPPPGLLFLKNFLEKLVEFVRNLIREQQHGAAGVNALHVRLNNAFDLRQLVVPRFLGTRQPGRFNSIGLACGSLWYGSRRPKVPGFHGELVVSVTVRCAALNKSAFHFRSEICKNAVKATKPHR